MFGRFKKGLTGCTFILETNNEEMVVWWFMQQMKAFFAIGMH
jgi:hypothetical protein